MPRPVKLADDIMDDAHKEAELRGRSVAAQITHWIRIGRRTEKSSNFDFQRVSVALKAGMTPDELTPAEQEVWFDQFATKMAESTKQEKAFHGNRRKQGRGVGMSSSGELIYEK